MASLPVRRALHILGGLAAPVLILLLGWAGAAALALLLLAYLLLAAYWGRHGLRLPIAWRLIEETARPEEPGSTTAVEYLAAVLLLGLLFPLPYFLGAIALLSVGDGVAGWVGERWGRSRLPWNPRKSWQGLLAGAAAGTVAYVGLGIAGAYLQLYGYAEGRSLLGEPLPWRWVAFVAASYLALQAGAAWMRRATHSPSRANAPRWVVAAALAVAAAPAMAFLALALRSGLDPILPLLGGHGPVGRAALGAVPILVMLVESGLRRHDNLVVPVLGAVLPYGLLLLVGPTR